MTMSEPIKDNNKDNKKDETFQSLSDRDLDLFTNQAAARSYYMSSHEYDYDTPPGKSFYSMHMDTTKQQEPKQWIIEYPTYFNPKSFFNKTTHSRFHDFALDGTDVIMEWSPYKPIGAVDQLLIKRRKFVFRLRLGKHEYKLSINYRWGIAGRLVEAGYGRWLGEIQRALKTGITRKISIEFNIDRTHNYG